MRLRFDKWRPLLDLGRIEHGLLLPILLYCTDPLGRPMLGPLREGPETEELLHTAYSLPSGTSGCRNASRYPSGEDRLVRIGEVGPASWDDRKQA